MQMIRNFLRAEKQIQDGSHGGQGAVDLYEIWGRSDFKSSVDFMDRVVIPPKSTIGYHRHGNNEEMYIVLGGQGTMTINDEPVTVRKGDMILNPAHGEHGLVNDSESEIDLLVIQITLEKQDSNAPAKAD
jgi:mannose-6-phosphate isomerase-like protein (cupin superfamily)